MVLVQKWLFSNFFSQAIQTRKISLTTFYNKKTTFQAIKTGSSKSRKIDIFSKRLTHGFGPKIATFLTFFRQYSPGKYPLQYSRKISLTTIQNKKTTFQAIKTRSSKRRKIGIFPKGLTYGFCAKMAIFLTFSFRQYTPGKYP